MMCGCGAATSAPSQRVITWACGEAMASASVISPVATSSSASESSLVSRWASDSVASQYARLSPSQQTVTPSAPTIAEM